MGELAGDRLLAPGYVARFDPELVVLDASGADRAREGDEMLASRPWHGLNVCFQSGGIVDVWEAGRWPSQPTAVE